MILKALKMKTFEQNKCQTCKKVFCCIQCREKHEISFHDIKLKCDICLYGKIFVSGIDKDLIDHLKNFHWPLHCVYCQRLFGSVEEIFEHKKCPIRYSSPAVLESSYNSPFTNYIWDEIKNELSPFALSNNFDLDKNARNANPATSTPMQKNDNCTFNNLKEIIMTSEKDSKKKDSILKKNNLLSCQSVSISIKRVSFSIPLTDSNKSSTPEQKVGTPSIMYYTATDEQQKDFISPQCESVEMLLNPIQLNNELNTPICHKTMEELPKQNLEKELNIPVCHKVVEDSPKQNLEKDLTAPSQKSTLWESATEKESSKDEVFVDVSDTPDTISPKNAQFLTPLVSNMNKKKLNIAKPIVTSEFQFLTPTTLNFKRRTNISHVPVYPNRVANDCISQSSAMALGKENINTDQIALQSLTESINEPSISTSVRNKMWKPISNMFRNFTSSLKSLSAPRNSSHKRTLSDSDLTEASSPKRFKFNNIKCRPAIRELPPSCMRCIRVDNETQKVLCDKATQTYEIEFLRKL